MKGRGRKTRVPPSRVVSSSSASPSSASNTSGSSSAAAGTPSPSAATTTAPPSSTDSSSQTELSSYTGWICRPLGIAGSGSQAYAFTEEDSDEISRNLFSAQEITLPGSKGVVNFCSRTVDLPEVGMCEIEFVFPRTVYAPWAPSIHELEQYAHGQEFYSSIVHPLFHWLWRRPQAMDPTLLEDDPKWIRLDEEQENGLEECWKHYTKDTTKKEYDIGGLGRVNMESLTREMPLIDPEKEKKEKNKGNKKGKAKPKKKQQKKKDDEDEDGSKGVLYLARVVYSWQWRNAKGWFSFNYEACVALEESKCDCQMYVYLDIGSDEQPYPVVVDFVEMCMFEADSNLVRYPIRRLGTPYSRSFDNKYAIKASTVGLIESVPKYWQRDSKTGLCNLTNSIPISSPEAQKIQRLMLYSSFAREPSPGSGEGEDDNGEKSMMFKLIELQRIQSVEMWKSFEMRRNKVTLEYTSRLHNESFSRDVAKLFRFAPIIESQSNQLYLFHPCEPSSLNDLMNGRCPSMQHFCRNSRWPLGAGYHFYESAEQATHFVPCPMCRSCPCRCKTQRTEGQTCFMLLCRVILGNGIVDTDKNSYLTQSAEMFRRKPDCIVRCSSDGTPEVIVYDYLQVYPEYVLTFTMSKEQFKLQQQYQMMILSQQQEHVLLIPSTLQHTRPEPLVIPGLLLFSHALDELDQRRFHEALESLKSVVDEFADFIPARIMILFLQGSHPLLFPEIIETQPQLLKRIGELTNQQKREWHDILNQEISAVKSPTRLFVLGEWDLICGFSKNESVSPLVAIKQSADEGSIYGMCGMTMSDSLLKNWGMVPRLATEQQYRYCLKAAMNRHAYAQYLLSIVLQKGSNVIHADEAESLHWLKEAAVNGVKEAYYSLAMRYYKCYPPNDVFNPEAAIRWVRLGAERGDVKCQLLMGFCLQHGFGVLPDAENAVRWYQVVVDNSQNPQAMWLLAECMEGGIGTHCNKEASERLYAMARENGVTSKPEFNKIIEESYPVVKIDPKTSMKASELGIDDYEYFMGMLYVNGKITPTNGTNIAHAKYWLQRASQHGNVDATKELEQLKQREQVQQNNENEEKPNEDVSNADEAPDEQPSETPQEQDSSNSTSQSTQSLSSSSSNPPPPES